jgi:hypothetical protein
VEVVLLFCELFIEVETIVAMALFIASSLELSEGDDFPYPSTEKLLLSNVQ